ncbi:hypothetical protein [Halanaeroarchaeum sulfurireducens]|uniref:Uncharacterized protein n=1 Tax=Halanaeroarchaeum sulfurireducens TaxID=1604004 RepID=A0A0F7P8R0_9EURY|nr:hypothetical protein [Halanaeroarchaeum sulfurireducens]AKH97556.1 hypothetical protein HLASF_1067 [Halanaeroarchaeum sulfurireducens]ALG81952.1 hypothetical protein HLASA_1056 [Halanaeroarchaeum sulfurireducens]
MNQKYVIGGIIVVVVLAVGIGAALYTGAGPAPGGPSAGDSEDTIEDFPTATVSDTETGSMHTTAAPPFSFTVDGIEECGWTCRDVTATLTNNQNETARNVVVYTRVFAGEDNTDTSDLVWEGTNEIGTLAPGDSITTTERVQLSFQDAQKIQGNDGWITIQTTVDSDDTRVTFQDSDQVA